MNQPLVSVDTGSILWRALFFFLSLIFFCPSFFFVPHFFLLSLSARLKVLAWVQSLPDPYFFLSSFFFFTLLFPLFCIFAPSFFCPPLMSPPSPPFSLPFLFSFSYSFPFLFFLYLLLISFFLPLSAVFLSFFPQIITLLPY